MSKSRYSKTKAAGLVSGVTRNGNIKFAMAKHMPAIPENRAARRMRDKERKA